MEQKDLQSTADERSQKDDRLDSWKEIARYLNRDVRTVQRWEKEEDLPIHRHPHHYRSSVFAFRRELDRWFQKRTKAVLEPPPERKPYYARLIKPAVFMLLVGIVGVGVLLLTGQIHFYHLEFLGAAQPSSRLLTSFLGHEMFPTMSPAGDYVAYSWEGVDGENDDIYVQEVEGGAPVRRTYHPGRDYSPVWSPNGGFLAFLRELSSGNTEVILVPPLSGPEEILWTHRIPSWTLGRQLAWTVDGDYLITSRCDSNGNNCGLFMLSIKEREGRYLTQPSSDLVGDHTPAVSPDGTVVSFVRSVGIDASDLFLLRLGAGFEPEEEPRRLTSLSQAISGQTWTPSGKRILFSAGTWPRARLWRTEVSPGARPELLPHAGESVYFPSLSSKHRLIYSRVKALCNIWRIPLNQGFEEKATLSSTMFDWLPEFAPDGTKVVFTSDRTGSSELWLSEVNNGEPKQLTQFESSHTGHTSWNAITGKLVFDSTVYGNSDIFILDPNEPAIPFDPVCNDDPPCVRKLTDHPAEDVCPIWSSDGLRIYFASKRSGRFQVWRISDQGRRMTQVTVDGGYFSAESQDGEWLFFTKWGELGVWKASLDDMNDARKILNAASGKFILRGEKLYYAEYPRWPQHGFCIKQLDLETGVDTVLYADSRHLAGDFSVAPDESSILLARYDQEEADLILIESFSCQRMAFGMPENFSKLTALIWHQ